MSATKGISTVSALLGGAALMYLFDPIMGARRRGILRDKLSHFSRVGRRAVNMTARDAAHRAQGVVAEVRQRLRDEPVIDDVLVERIRSQMGRVVAHHGSVNVSASEGQVTLSGSVLGDEHDRLLSAVRKIRGVTNVNDQLECRAA